MTTTEIDMSRALGGICRTHPSICSNMMSYRVELDPPNRHSFTAIRKYGYHHEKLVIPGLKNSNGEEIIEDCRLFWHNGNVWFSVTNREVIGIGYIGMEPRTIRVQWLHFETVGSQKNWAFFSHENDLLCAFSIMPHRILQITDTSITECNITDTRFPWSYGDIRGGTPPIRYGNLYFAFFHSHIEGQTVRETPTRHPSDVALNPDNKRRTYYAAPYAFEAAPPFRVVLAPKRPMIWPRMYAAQDLAPNGHDVVFPCSLEIEGDSWEVAWGDDERCWLSTFSTKEIFDNLYAP